MAYQAVKLPSTIPDQVRTVINGAVDPIFQDVHWMLSVTRGEDTHAPPRQLQVPIAHMLLGFVSGFSEEMYSPQTNKLPSGKRFVQCMEQFFPWDVDPPRIPTSANPSKILYEVFRNPLVHRLGLHRRRRRAVRIVSVFRGHSNAEQRIECLERLDSKPYSEPCLVMTCTETTLWLDPLYWGIRKMVERWATDPAQIRQAAERLTVVGV